MIPKIVHYIWLGSSVPARVERLIAENARLLQGYDVRVWTENDIEVRSPFVEWALKNKMWAFASDYIRFELLKTHGGIYLDTDMRLLKSLDIFLNCDFFAGLNAEESYIYCGIVGASKGNTFIGDVVKAYDRLPHGQIRTSPEVLTDVYVKNRGEGASCSVRLYRSAVFYPFSQGEKKDPERMKKAYADHLWGESWRSFVLVRRIFRRIGLISLIHSLQGISNRRPKVIFNSLDIGHINDGE